jgi:hypothetical protein
VQVQRLLICQGLWNVVRFGVQGPAVELIEGNTIRAKETENERTGVSDAKASAIIMGLCATGALYIYCSLEQPKSSGRR